MKRIISIIVLTAMFTAIAVGLAGCGVKTTLRSGNDPIIGKWKCNEAYDENFDWKGILWPGYRRERMGNILSVKQLVYLLTNGKRF